MRFEDEVNTMIYVHLNGQPMSEAWSLDNDPWEGPTWLASLAPAIADSAMEAKVEFMSPSDRVTELTWDGTSWTLTLDEDIP